MKRVIIVVYKFYELSESVQEKLIKSHHDIHYEKCNFLESILDLSFINSIKNEIMNKRYEYTFDGHKINSYTGISPLRTDEL